MKYIVFCQWENQSRFIGEVGNFVVEMREMGMVLDDSDFGKMKGQERQVWGLKE